MTNAAPPICVACKGPVEVYPALYYVHGQMHLLCFHLVYEHELGRALAGAAARGDGHV